MRRTWTLLIAVALALGLATPAAAASVPPGGSFIDDDGNVHEAMIEAIAAEGITRGCNPPANDRYCPRDAVSRGQMAAFMVRALNLPASSTDYFTDDDGSVFEADIQALRLAGITKGCNPPANDRFCPGDLVTRGEMAAFLTRAFAYPATATDYFGDDEASIFERDINALAAAGVTKGCNPPANTDFCPDAEVERDQMASFLGRALELAPVQLPVQLDLLEGFSVTCYEYEEYEECYGEGVWPADERFYIRHGWVEEAGNTDPEGFESAEFRLYKDGTRLDMTYRGIMEIDGVRDRFWTRDFPNGLPAGTTELTGHWIDYAGNVKDFVITIAVTFE